MRAEDKLHFSPKYTFAEMDFDDEGKLVEAFKDRVYGFYLNPAKSLDQNKFGFGCGLLCVATIDFLARIMYSSDRVGCRFRKWLKSNIDEFKEEDLAQRFYEDFRNGLVHEGRIKNPGEFSYENPEEIVSRDDGIIRINPSILLRRIEESFERYVTELKENLNTFGEFKDRLKKDFGEEVERERRA